MNDPQLKNTDDPGSTIDGEIAWILDKYLSDRARGTALGREDWLKQHPQFADRLAECLDAADLFGGAQAGGFDLTAASNAGGMNPGMPESIGDFQILRELGRGGMGVVYEAREKSLDRIVALKVMRFGIVDPNALDRFRREAETAGALHHTNIVPVYATGREGDTSWYAMQRIEGESLADRLSRVRDGDASVEIADILDLGIQAADALGHAHQRDVVHRDVKPANLILDGEDRVWLTDFGLARRLVDVGATVTGAILGTPRYMSPEQADLTTTDVDHRSDVYSLGATLYEMACGQPPFQGDDPFELIAKIRHEDPAPVRALRPELPRDLEVVLQRAMEKDPRRRYQTAAEFAEDLRAIRDDHPIQARPLSMLERAARTARKHHAAARIAIGAMAATALLITVAVLMYGQWKQSQTGAFRIRAGGGPYQATVFPAGESVLSDASSDFTLPMQTFQDLDAGDYEMMVAPQGKWSQRMVMPVTKGVPSEYRLTSQHELISRWSIKGAIATTVAHDDGPAILWRREGTIRKLTTDSGVQWERDFSNVQTLTTAVGPGSSVSSDDLVEVNFANTRQSSRFDRGQHSVDDNPLSTQGTFALRNRIDLDGDGRSDSLIAATDCQALLAVDHEGEVLWSRSYQFAGLPFRSSVPEPFERSKQMPFPGVFDLQKVQDVDDDNIPDVLATLVHYQMALQTDVCLVLVSGKTGMPIRWGMKKFGFKPDVFWPADGMFTPEKRQYRPYAGLGFHSTAAYRSGHRSTNDFVVRHRPGSTPIRIPVPSPPEFVFDGEVQKVVMLTGTECHVFDWQHMEKTPDTIQLPFTPARAPSLARSDRNPILVFHDHQSAVGTNKRIIGTAVAAYDLSGSQLWQTRLEHVEWRNAIGQNHADWPLVVDVNHDGNDEVVLPTSRYLNGVEIGVTLIDAASGKPVWSGPDHYSALQTADDCLSRIQVCDDIDGDGWDEIVTASVSGPGVPAGVEDGTALKIYVYVDWVSGKTGRQIAWARHPIPVVGDEIRVAEIDAIRCGVDGTEMGTVEIDLVTGDRTLDVSLASAVIQFHPSRPGATAIANGLDACEVNIDPEADGTSDRSSVSRVYRYRGGPFGVGEDWLMFLPLEQKHAQRLGESRPVASWSTKAGRNLVALSGLQPVRFSVVDVQTKRTVWSSNRVDAHHQKWIPLRRRDGSVDFLVQRQSGNDSPVSLVDGETGEPIFQMVDPPGGRIVQAVVSDDGRSIVIVGDGHLNANNSMVRPVANPSQRDDAFRVSCISMATGRVRWSTPFLEGAPRMNYPMHYDDLRLADLDGDAVDDVIGPNVHDDLLFLAAWNGVNGELMWEQPLHAKASYSDYWIPFTLTEIDERTHVVYFGRSSKEIESPGLVLCGPNGAHVATYTVDQATRFRNVDGGYSYRSLAISNAPQSDGPASIAFSFNHRGKARCLIFELIGGQILLRKSIDESQKSAMLVGMWFRDVDGDGASERLVMNRMPNSSLSIRCYTIDQSDPRFRVEVPDATGIDEIQWRRDHGALLSWLSVDDQRYVGVDWSQGKLIAESTVDPQDPSNFPVLCSSGKSPMLAFPTADGIEFRTFDARKQDSVSVVHTHSHFDPRRTKQLLATIGGNHSLGDWILGMLRDAVLLGFVVVLPLWYLQATVRRRRWSLSWTLLAPVIVGFWMVAWQSRVPQESSTIFRLLNGLTLWMCVVAILFAIRASKDSMGYAVRRMLCIGTPLVFLAMVFYAYPRDVEPMIRYQWNATGLLWAALLSLTIVVQIYWVLRIAATVIKFLSRMTRRQVPS